MNGVILDRHGGVASMARRDPASGDMLLQDAQDCDAVLERCAAERAADALRGHRKSGFMGLRCIAELPVVLVDALREQGLDIMQDKEALRRVLNDPQWAAFRCSQGRV